MSLRPDDRGVTRSHSRSGRSRSRSQSHVRAPSSHSSYAAEVRQPSTTGQEQGQQYNIVTPGRAREGEHSAYGANMAHQPTVEDEFTMGDYADLPPEERPGYVPSANSGAQAQSYQYAQPGQLRYTSVPQQSSSAPKPGQYSYTAVPQQHPPTTPLSIRTPSSSSTQQPQGGYQYARVSGDVKYTANPVTGQQGPPNVPYVPHTAAPTSRPQPQHSQSEPYNVISPGSVVSPHTHAYAAPLPPPPTGPPPQSQQPRTQYNAIEVVPGGSSKKEKLDPSSGRRPHSKSVSGQRPPPSPGLRPHSLSVSGQAPNLRPHSLSVSGQRPDLLPPSPGRLSVGNIPTIAPGQAPPPSPLLEAYHGTYQSISPMPFPTHLPDDDIDDLSLLSPRVSSSSVNRHAVVRHRSVSRRRSPSRNRRSPSRDRRSPPQHRRNPSGYEHRSPSRRSPSYSPPGRHAAPSRSPSTRKRVTMYEFERDARDIADALSHSSPRFSVLTDILPGLSHDQIMELRREYKRVCKIHGQGINIAKHIKMKATAGSNFGKIAYVTALGRWESEGYWANYWYQSNSAKRELLIEALMGRPNSDIHAIKDSFKDKRYSDSLMRCMDKELKADKFRKAILVALEERRQEEDQVWPKEYVERDVRTLYEALQRREGGESAIIEIVVTRSDRHLKECLRTYERRYGGNFAKDCLKKSNNLVGEITAHILNGVINRPARDAMLLHHALEDLATSSSAEKDNPKHERKDRYELLISRLVRVHWEPLHFARVKNEYRDKYRVYLEEDIEQFVRGEEFREFCLGLCEVRDRVGRVG